MEIKYLEIINIIKVKMKILFYTVNGVGLGHLNRCLVLADAIKKLDPSVDIFFITNSSFTKPIKEGGYSFIQLQISNDSNCLLDDDGFSLFKNTIDNEKPDLIVYDTHYEGRMLRYA